MSTIKSKLESIQKALDKQIESAPVFIAGDRLHCWEILKGNAGTCKIAVGFDVAKARINFRGGDITGRDDQYYYAVISRGRGLGMVRSDNMIYGSGGGKPLFELAEIMRDFFRAIRFDEKTDEQPDYISMGNSDWPLDKFGIDAYEVKIWVGTQLPLFQPLQINQNVI